MASGSSNIYPFGPGATAPFEEREELDDVASAVSALTTDDLSGLRESLNAADAWDVDDGHCGGGILANQF